MIDALHDLAQIILAWCIGVTITYGIVESLFPPLMGFRIWFASWGEPLWWGEVLIYCPYCVGFWVQGFAGLVIEPSPWGFVRGAAIGTAVLLLLRSVAGTEIIQSKYDGENGEKTVIATMRRPKAEGN